MNGIQSTAAVYELKNVECTALEWEQQVKNSLLDYIDRLGDLGDQKRLAHCQEEYWRLEKTYEPNAASV